MLATIPWLPESPRWLLNRGREAEGAAVLAALEGNGATVHSPVIVTQKREILEAVRIERDCAPSWSDVLKGNTGNTGMVKRLFLGLGMCLVGSRRRIIDDDFQVLSGCNNLSA